VTQFLIDQELHENCVPREQHRAEVAAAEERGAAKERERCAAELQDLNRRLHGGRTTDLSLLADRWGAS